MGSVRHWHAGLAWVIFESLSLEVCVPCKTHEIS